MAGLICRFAFLSWKKKEKNFAKKLCLLSEELDVLKCEKCLRAVGLWLFECMFYENNNEISNEIKLILDKLINAIEFSSDSFYYYDYTKVVDETKSSSNKRKLDTFLVLHLNSIFFYEV